jgi:hypothetical protein
MDPIVIFAIAACLLCAGVVYVVLQVRHYGESQTLTDKILKAEAETASTKKKLLGYTKYSESLDAGKQAVADQLKPPLVKVVREYVHVEKFAKDKFKLKAEATVIVKYSVEFLFGIDLSPANVELVDAANGVGVKISRPALLGTPTVKTQSHQVISAIDVPDEKVLLNEIHPNFAILAKRYGVAMTSEEPLRAACKMKVLECLRDFLAKQDGVQRVPAIFADFK